MSEQQLDKIQSASVQKTDKDTHRTSTFGFHLLNHIAKAGQVLPAWWSRARDVALRRFVKESDHLSGATNNICARLSAIPSRIEARDATIKAHRRLADVYNIIWQELSDFGQGKESLIYKIAQDWYTTDNGWFVEIIGEGDPDGPIEGQVLGLAHLDSVRCTRTGDLEFPVVYTNEDGDRFKLHRTRVAFASSMPSTSAEMYDVGFCASSRCVNNAQHLIDIGNYEQEKLGSRPKRQILITQGGLDPDDAASAFDMADRSMDNQGLARYSKAILMGDSSMPDANLVTIDLASIPDGFDKQTSTTLGMFAIALAFGVPPRWLWPATQTGATKADAMFQHIAGQGPGVGHFLSVLTTQLAGSPQGDLHLGGKFLPSTLRLVFDFQDDEQDRQVAENKKVRVEGWEKHLQNKTMDVRTVREQMLRAGDLNDDQFRRLELEDGRLPDGRDVLSLFSSTQPLFLRLLDLGVANPLSIEANDPADMILEINAAALETQDFIVNAPSVKQKQQAELALAALGKLKGIYEQILTEEIQQEQMADLEAQEQETAQTETPTEEEQETKELTPKVIDEIVAWALKQFNFGASVGEVIRGKLARGAGGQFVNVEELKAQLQQDILDRLRARQGAEGLTAAELARLENREAVLELLGGKISAENMEALAGLRSGETPTGETLQALKNAGLVTEFEDGSIASTAQGRAFMNAANSGDVDRATAALGKAAESAKPKKAGGGGGGKTEEQKRQEKLEQERERERERQAELAANRETVRDSVDIDGSDVDALVAFDEGAPLDANTAKRMAQEGLVEFDSQGNARFTTDGRKLVSSANKGDVRDANDAISKGRDRVAKTRERIAKDEQSSSDVLERAESEEEKAAEMQEDIDRLLENASVRERQSTETQDAVESEKLRQEALAYREQAQRAIEQQEKLLERADGLRERADEIQERIQKLLAQIGESQTKEYGDFAHIISQIQKAVQGTELETKQVEESEEPPRGNFEDELDKAIRAAFRKTQKKITSDVLAGRTPDYDKLKNELFNALLPIITDAAIFMFNFYEDDLQLQIDDGEITDIITEWAVNYTNQVVNGLINTTNNLATQAKQEEDKGVAATIIARAFDPGRALRIAITETTVGLAFGALLFQKEAKQRFGVELEAVWFTRLDERVCPVCRPLHGKSQKVWSEVFPGGPPAHVHCRCGVLIRQRRR